MHHNSFYAGGNAFHSPGSDLNRPIVFFITNSINAGFMIEDIPPFYEHNTAKAGTLMNHLKLGSGVEHSFDGYYPLVIIRLKRDVSILLI